MRIAYVEVVPGRLLPERTAFVAAVLGIAMGVLFLFAPIQGGCMTTATSTVPGQIATPGPTICTNESLVQRQPIWPLPFLAVAVWSVAAPAQLCRRSPQDGRSGRHRADRLRARARYRAGGPSPSRVS